MINNMAVYLYFYKNDRSSPKKEQAFVLQHRQVQVQVQEPDDVVKRKLVPFFIGHFYKNTDTLPCY